MNLERELRALEIEWPATPALSLELAPRRRRLWPLAAALAVAALAAALAVPQSRGAILRFFHLGGATIRVVDTLPPAESAPLTSGLGDVIPLRSARRSVAGFLVPPVEPPPPVHYTPGNVVSMVFLHDGRPVLLSELPGGAVYLKKLASGSSRLEGVSVRGAAGIWISGEPHVVTFLHRSPRLAGDVLLWATSSTTYRLEGPGLTRDDAIRLALSLRRG